MKEADELRNLAQGHSQIVLAFTGGKDSLACLELARMAGIRPALLWVNTGATLQHMDEFIRQAVEGYELIEVRTDQRAQWREHGLP